MIDLDAIQKAIRDEGLDGWLFCNFRHRDTLCDEILERPPSLTNSRLYFYAIPASGQPRGFLHAIETDHLAPLPGDFSVYVSREDLVKRLSSLRDSTAKGGTAKGWAVHASAGITAISFLDAGTAQMLRDAGLELCGAESLIQRFKSLLDSEGIASHERAAAHLYEIVGKTWQFAADAHKRGKNIFEGDLRQVMEDEFAARGLERDHPPLAAAGKNSANPHYDFSGRGEEIREGDIIQLDLWAKDKTGNAIYADISWVGIFAEKAGAGEKIFRTLLDIRKKSFDFIANAFARGEIPSGADVDRETRRMLTDAGFSKAIRHRTGHGIDSLVHGSGVNIDSVEFPDNRKLLEGSCFSLEPGIYLENYGFRTEVDVYISGGSPHISGGETQKKLLVC